jgi:hypothetical protein
MLPDPIPSSELESVSLQRRFFLLVSRFLIAFSSLSSFSLNCTKDCFVGLVFFTPFFGCLEIGFLVSIFLVPMTLLCVVRGICAPMFLGQVTMLLSSSFLWIFVSRLRTGSLISFLGFCRCFLIRLCIGSFLGTYALNSLKALKKRTHAHGIQSFLVKVELMLPRMWAHPKNMTG